MQTRLNYAVVHELLKDTGTTRARSNLANDLLGSENPVVVDLVERIISLIGKRENMAHYGVFRDDATATRIPDIVKSYCVKDDPTPDSFQALTNDCMEALRDRAQSQNLATGGYLLFVDYTRANRFFLVAMIKQRSGITMEGLVPTSITELDLAKLHQVARVAFDRLRSYQAAVADRQDKTYVTFVSPKGSQQAAGYFVNALGCQPGTPASVATKEAIVGTVGFFDAHQSIKSQGQEAKVDLIDFLRTKADSGERVTLSEIVEVARRHFPLEQADDLTSALIEYLQSEDHRVPAEFPVSKRALNRYARFRYRSSQLNVEIEKSAVSLDDSGPIYFDQENRRLIISDDDFITELGAALQDDE